MAERNIFLFILVLLLCFGYLVQIQTETNTCSKSEKILSKAWTVRFSPLFFLNFMVKLCVPIKSSFIMCLNFKAKAFIHIWL